MSISAYPLQWPAGWKRSDERKRGAFSTIKGASRERRITVNEGIERILQQLAYMGIGRDDLVISSNLITRMDGLPRGDQKAPNDPGVAVYWMDGKEPRCMAIDIYSDVAQNMGAISRTLDAMRAIERHGGSEIGSRAFTGFMALPESTETTPNWRDVLGFKHGTKVSAEDVQLQFRALSKKNHPDTGGDAGAFAMLVRAKEMAIAELGNV